MRIYLLFFSAYYTNIIQKFKLQLNLVTNKKKKSQIIGLPFLSYKFKQWICHL